MFSSKTTKLLTSLEKFKYQNKKVVAFKPKIDDRYSKTDIVTHSTWSYPAVLVSEGKDILSYLASTDDIYDVIAVDELFMISGASEILIWLFKRGMTIVVSSLDLSAAAKPFHEVEKILPFATVVEKCSAVCTVCGNDAHYTYKKADDIRNVEISVGGSEMYEPRCFKHCAAMKDLEDLI
jgi:thymidine kinase